MTKVIQLYDTMNVRFGVMLVGPTGGGKSECYRTLQGAVTRLRSQMSHKDPAFQVCGLVCILKQYMQTLWLSSIMHNKPSKLKRLLLFFS